MPLPLLARLSKSAVSFSAPRLATRAASSFTKLRATPSPIYYVAATGAFTLAPTARSVPLGATDAPATTFIPALPAGDVSADGTSDGVPGFTAPASEYTVPPPSQFYANPTFLNLLKDTLTHHIHECPTYNSLAEGELFIGGSTLHIYDLRAPPPYGRIPDVQDIIGTVRIQEPVHGEGINKYEVPPIVPGSFEPNDMYRVLTRNGFMTLSELLHKRLTTAAQTPMYSDEI
ncbi:uncharacterized protein SAPINGB_P006428 [Magnusiomyces paraingens]|uniref:Uncharacterized protein n=1 Tax=Magnusiomyces paraingens TaxID=2606893 RepID=A0A5E8C7L8_9ASCO|nr:uncharacterized protein SAPINGB_P006428 [Saprochaete ingens]VVT58875.1 unnamed protein product [Saprochaete ingens]